jgi:hypothetical protein
MFFVGLIIVTELMFSEAIAPQVLFSTSAAVTFSTLLLFGPWPAALVAMVGGITITLVAHARQARSGRAPLLQRALFNMAALGLANAFGGMIFLLSGGTVGEIVLLSDTLPALVAATCIEFANAALVVGVVYLQTRQPAREIWRQNVSRAVPVNILTMAVGGGGLALGYQIADILGLGVFVLPIAMIIYAFSLYVPQTKAQMARLEEIVAERTHNLEKANEELGHLDQDKNHFFSVVNHEIWPTRSISRSRHPPPPRPIIAPKSTGRRASSTRSPLFGLHLVPHSPTFREDSVTKS